MATGAAWAAAALTAKSGYDAREDRKDQKKEVKKAEASQKKLKEEEMGEKFRAKRGEYEASRSLLRRGQARGRASTVLDKRDSVG